jgi:hypothetical protein
MSERAFRRGRSAVSCRTLRHGCRSGVRQESDVTGQGDYVTSEAVPSVFRRVSWRPFGGFPIKMRHLVALIVLVSATLLSSLPALAQFSQQGPKLVGTGAVGNAEQGVSVALSADGNTAIVGGPFDGGARGSRPNIGAAWIWTRSGGVWTQQGTKLVGSGAVLDFFGNVAQGMSVALSADGNTALVGGPSDNGGGAAWVWTRNAGTWTQQGPKLVGSGAVVTAWQGYSVSLSADGNTAIVGGGLDNNQAGAAWIWTRSGGVWTQQGPKLVGSGAVGNAGQGYSVSLSADGNTAMVGGGYDNGGAGAAWVWTRSGGVWTQQGAKLVGSGAAVSLSADGDTAIVGGHGAAWIWTRSEGVWTQQGTKLVGSNAGNQGSSVSLCADGNTALVGGAQNNGATLVWARSGGIWAQQGTNLVGSGAVGFAFQGQSVSLSGDGSTAIVGGNGDNGFAGAAWVFASAGATPTLTAALSANPASGPAPLSTTLTATAGGTASGTVNYTFWWNCTDAGTSVSTVTAACGDPTNATFGANFDSVNGATQAASTTYAAQGTYSAKVIIERGSAPPAEQRTSITATSPVLPAPAVSAVSPSSGPTTGGTAVTITGTHFAAATTVTIGGTAAPTTEAPQPWAQEMGADVCSRLGATLVRVPDANVLKQICQANGWDVWIWDWQSQAKTPIPQAAWINAGNSGEALASLLKLATYSHIHFIAHSAGAHLVDAATVRLKDAFGDGNIEIHETFLDAYDPWSNPSYYGKRADWADNYVDIR